MKTFVVIGLGRFGSAVALELSELGHEVLALDEIRSPMRWPATPGIPPSCGPWACATTTAPWWRWARTWAPPPSLP